MAIPNFEERHNEFDESRRECELAKSAAWDQYVTETNRIASEEHSISKRIFQEFLSEEMKFYADVNAMFSSRMSSLEKRSTDYPLSPCLTCDLTEHCSQRVNQRIAYPIEISVSLMEPFLREEGLFRITPSHGKQKRFLSELDLQLIDKSSTLDKLNYDVHVPAAALKQYLRELPNCLLTNDLLPQWNEISSLTFVLGHAKRVDRFFSLRSF